MTHLIFQLAGRLHIISFSHVSILGLRQAVPVSFPIWQPWELVQQHKRLRDHVLGQKLCSVLAQLGDVRAAGRNICHQVLLAEAVFVDNGNGLLHSFKCGQVVVDLCQLYPEATQLHLWVQAMTRGESCVTQLHLWVQAMTTGQVSHTSAAHQLYPKATQLHLWVQAMTRGGSCVSGSIKHAR